MLIGQLKNIRAQIGLYRQGGHSKEKLLEISQDLRGQSRGLMETLGTAAMQAALLPPHMQHLSGMLKGFQKELRATGILAEKQAPQIIVTSRAEVSIPAPAAAVMAAPAISTSAPASIQAIPASCEQTPVPQASAAEIKNAPVPGQPHASELAVKESRPVPKTESNAEPKVETASPVLTPPHVQSQVQAPSIKTEAVTRSASMAAAPQPRLTDGPLPSSPLTQERQAPSILPPAPPRMPADIWAQSKSDSQPDPRRASGNGPVAAPDDAKRDKSNFVHGLQIKTMIGDAIVVAKSAVAPLNPVTGKTEVKKTFKAAATGACAGCGGGDCAACTRGAKIAAMKTDLHATYG
jgi:hypothetical protein